MRTLWADENERQIASGIAAMTSDKNTALSFFS
jgi:hypothetical protein